MGIEFVGKKFGIIGLGVIGVLVVNDVLLFGMDVVGYDLFVLVDMVWRIFKEVECVMMIEEVLVICDYLIVYVFLMDKICGMFNVDIL